MIVGFPYRHLVERSDSIRTLIKRFNSEQWSFLGFGCLLLTPAAAYWGLVWLYALLLLGHDICDINDGYVYSQKENGINNGYGLYLDHMLDSIGAALVAYATYRIMNAPTACVIGLSLYYLIAIHSWLYKIVKVAHGDHEGVYYAVTVSVPKSLWLNVDDLTLLLAIAAFTRWRPLLYFIDFVLGIILVVKFTWTSRELRKTLWHSVGVSRVAPNDQ